MNIDTSKLTRVTVVNDEGLVCELRDGHVILSLQDEDRTLKVFFTRSESVNKRLRTQVPQRGGTT